jgi:hypothetical protein
VIKKISCPENRAALLTIACHINKKVDFKTVMTGKKSHCAYLWVVSPTCTVVSVTTGAFTVSGVVITGVTTVVVSAAGVVSVLLLQAVREAAMTISPRIFFM